MLAELPSSTPLDIAGWCGCAFFLAAGYNQVVKAVDRAKDKPAPADVRAEAHGTFATKADFTALEGKLTEQRVASEESRARIYRQIDDVRRELDGKIDGMPGRIIAELANLNVLVKPGQPRPFREQP